MPLQLRPVIREEAADDLLLGWRAGGDEPVNRRVQIDQRTVDIVVVRLVQVAENVLDPAFAEHIQRGPEIVGGIDFTEQEKGVRIDAGFRADLFHAAVAETLFDSETGKQAEQVEVALHQVRHFHLPIELHHRSDLLDIAAPALEFVGDIDVIEDRLDFVIGFKLGIGEHLLDAVF